MAEEADKMEKKAETSVTESTSAPEVALVPAAEQKEGESSAEQKEQQPMQGNQQGPSGSMGKKQRWQQRGRFRNRNGNGGNPSGGQPPPQAVPRNPDLPEYKLADIHSWDNATIIEKMWPDANAEDLGAMKRHEIIFFAIRSYLARGGATIRPRCPNPIGVKISTTRIEYSLGFVSRTIRRVGNVGIRFSKWTMRAASLGVFPFTVSTPPNPK